MTAFDTLPDAPQFPVTFQEEKYFDDRPRSIDELCERFTSSGLSTRGCHFTLDD